MAMRVVSRVTAAFGCACCCARCRISDDLGLAEQIDNLQWVGRGPENVTLGDLTSVEEGAL